MTAPIMPKATAVWLIDNTTLTFRQIGKFCELHELEVQAIADGDVTPYSMGYNPITNGQLSMDEIKRCEADPMADLVASVMENNVKEINANTNCNAKLFEFNDDDLRESIKNSDILTNATSVGMAPNVDCCLIKDKSMLRPDLIVSDIIYNPRKTKLITMAEEVGCKTFNGMYMLLYQGAEAFRIWTGKDMPTEEIKKKFFS